MDSGNLRHAFMYTMVVKTKAESVEVQQVTLMFADTISGLTAIQAALYAPTAAETPPAGTTAAAVGHSFQCNNCRRTAHTRAAEYRQFAQ
jgi:hypothetical protein